MKRTALQRWIPFRLAALVAPLIAAWPQSVRAADVFWDRGSATNAWGTGGNWSPTDAAAAATGAVPAAGDVAVFNISALTAAQTIDLGADRTISGLRFVSSGTVLVQGGGAARILNLGASGITKTGSGAVTIGSATATQNTNTRLTADQTWANNAAAGTISVLNTVAPNVSASRLLTLSGSNTLANVVSGVISDTGNGVLSINKTGAGNWVLSGANTYTGLVTISDGTLTLQNNAGLGSTLAKTVVNGTGTLNLGGTLGANALGTTETIDVQGTGAGGIGAIVNTGTNGQQNALQGVVNLTGDATFGGTQRWDLRNGVLNGGGFNLTKVGNNSVFLSGSGRIGTALNQLIIQRGEYVMETAATATSTNITSGIAITPEAGATATFRSWGNSVNHTAAVAMDSSAAGAVARLRAENGWTTHSGAISVTGADNRLEANNSNGLILTGSVTGAGTLRKEDAGSLVWNASGALGGDFNLNGGILAGGGTISSPNVNQAAGTTLSPGFVGVSSATLTISGNLTSNGANAAVFNVGTSSDAVAVGGALTQNGTTTVSIVPGVGYGAGSYPLYTAGGGVGGAGTFVLPQVHLDAALQTTAGGVNLVVNSAAVPAWSGASNNIWATGSFTNPVTPNWAYAPQPGGLVEFVAGDSVLFDDSATGSTRVLVSGTVAPTSTRFNNSALDYVIEGTIGGAGPVVKDGTGRVTFLSNLANTGGLVINSGTVQLGDDSRQATAVTPISVASGATLAISAGGNAQLNVDLAAPVSGSGTIVLNATQQDRYHNFTADRGNVALRDLGAFTGSIVVNDGNRLQVNTAGGLGGTSAVTIQDGGGLLFNTPANFTTPVSISGLGWQETTGHLGAIRMSGGAELSGPVTLTGDSRITAYNSTGTISGSISGPHDVEFGLRQIGNTSSGTLALSHPASTWSGDASIIRMNIDAATLANAGVASSLGQGSNLSFEAATLRLTGAGAMTTDRTILINQGGQGGGSIGLTDPGATLTITGPIVNGNATFPISNLDFQNTSGTALGTGGTIILDTATPILSSTTTVHRQNLVLAGNTNFTVGQAATGTTAAPVGFAGNLNLGNNTGGTNAGPVTLTIRDNATLTTYGNFDAGNQNPGFVPASGPWVTINQTGGTVNALRGGGSFIGGSNDAANRAMRLGHWGNGTTEYNLSAGTLNVPNGYMAVAWDGNATFRMTGGEANVRGIRMGNAANVVGILNLDGGTLNIGDLGIARGNATTTNLINLNGGVLRATANTAIGSGLPIDVLAGGAIVDTNGFDVSSGSAFRAPAAGGSGGLVKNGSGLLELPTGNTFTGATTVNAGSLGGSAAVLTASNVTVKSGASVSGGATFSAPTGTALTVESGGSVSPGNASGAGLGTITATTVDLKAGSHLNLTPGAAGTRDFVNVTTAGGLTTPAVGQARLNVLPVGTLAAGTYDLVQYVTSIGGGGFSGLQPVLPHLITPSVTDNGSGLIQLTHAGQESLTWTGAAGGAWDGTAVNFNASVSGAVPFINGDVTVFDTTTAPAVTTITVAGAGVTPAGVTVNDGPGGFTFNGGPIAGGGAFTKTGTGTTVLANDNTYTGTTTISAGTLQIGNGGAAGTIGAGSVVNDGTLAFNRTGSAVVRGVISGSGIVRHDGPGKTVLTAANTYAGGTVLSKGTLEAWNAAGFGTGTITINDAATGASDTSLFFNPFNTDAAQTVNNPIIVTDQGTGRVTIGSSELSNAAAGLIFSASSTLTLGRDVTLTGDLDRTTWEGVISGTVDTINIAPSPALDATLRTGRVSWSAANVFTPANAAFTTINIMDRAILQAGQATTTVAVDQIPDTATVNVMAGGTFQFGIANDGETIGDLTGSGTVRNITNTALGLTFGTARDTVFSGVINGGNQLSFIKQGSGTATWSGSLDNPAGNITVNEGVVVLAKDSTPTVHALGSNSTVNADGTLRLGGTWAYTRPESDGRNGLNSAPTDAPANYVDQIYNGAGLTVNADGTFDMAGRSEAINSLAGAGRVTNTGAAPSVLYVGANNGSGSFTGSLEDGAGGLSLVKTGNGTLTLGGSSTYTGVTEVRGSTIAITHPDALGATSAGTILGPSRDATGGTNTPTVNINITTASDPTAPNIVAEPFTLVSETSNDQRSQVTNAAESTRLTGAITILGDGLVQFGANQAAGDRFELAGPIGGSSNGIVFLRGNGELMLSGVINAPALVLAKTDPGTLILNATGHDYAEATLVHGTVRADVVNALDTGAVLRMGQNGNANTLDINGNNQTVAGVRLNFGVNSVHERAITNSSATTADFIISPLAANGGNHNYAGSITGNLRLIKEGPGFQALSTPVSGVNSYTGDTIIREGGIRLGNSNLIPDGASAGNLVVGTGAASAWFDVNGNAETVNGLHGGASGVVSSNGAGLGSLTVSGTSTPAVSATFAGVLRDNTDGGAGQLSLTKSGPGIQILTGLNTYTGPTAVTGGELQVNGSIGTSSLVTVSTGGTLSGTGVVGAVSLTGGSLSPGASPGILTTGSVTTAAGSTVSLEVGGLTVGTQFDRIVSNGTVSIGGGVLAVSLINSFVPTQNDSFLVWENDDTDLFAGFFDGLGEGAALPIPETSGNPDLDGDYWMVTYQGGSGNDLVLTYVPEPGAAGLALAGALPLLRRRRRRPTA